MIQRKKAVKNKVSDEQLNKIGILPPVVNAALMFRQIAVFTAFVALNFSALAQANLPVLATPIATPFYSTGTMFSGTLAGLSADGPPVAAGNVVPSADGFYVFTAESQGVKVEATSGPFDLGFQILTIGEGFVGEHNLGLPGEPEEWFATGLTPGEDYLLRVFSVGPGPGAFDVKVETLPAAEMRPNYSPDPPTDTGIYGYRISDDVKRNNINESVYPINLTPLVQRTQWRLRNVATGETFYHQVNGTSSLLQLNDVNDPGTLCYDQEYMISCQLRVGGKWCGFGTEHLLITEEYPSVTVLPEYWNDSFLLQPGNIRTNYLGDGQQVQWRFTTNIGSPEGATVIDYTDWGSNSSYCYFQNVECMRYNKIYQVEVRASFCDLTGPWSDPIAIITEPIPHTNVRPEYCGEEMYMGSYMLCEYIEGADQYAWITIPVDPDDPEMTPIGAASTATSSNSNAITMNAFDVEYGQSYSVGVKAQLGAYDSCGDYQEADFGSYCVVHMIDLNAQFAPDEAGEALVPVQEELFITDRMEVVQTALGQNITLDIRDAGLNGSTDFSLYGINGQLIQRDRMMILPEIDQVQLWLNNDLSTGVYVLQAVQGEQQVSTKFYIR